MYIDHRNFRCRVAMKERHFLGSLAVKELTAFLHFIRTSKQTGSDQLFKLQQFAAIIANF